jgi:hypothetical protein
MSVFGKSMASAGRAVWSKSIESFLKGSGTLSR